MDSPPHTDEICNESTSTRAQDEMLSSLQSSTVPQVDPLTQQGNEELWVTFPDLVSL
jgi:hypothetical protein